MSVDVRALLRRQFPAWADLPLVPVSAGATDNVVVRLGPDLLVRVPRHADAAARLERELRWLPEIGPRLTVAVPEVVGVGGPDVGVDHRWVVQRWLPGRDVTSVAPADLPAAAEALVVLLDDLRGIDPDGGPLPGPVNSLRGAPLADLDERVRWGAAVTVELGDRYDFTADLDVARALTLWQEALDAPARPGLPGWLHGDLLPGNVLLDGPQLTAVVDFGCLAVGDPACDLAAAWTLLRGRARARLLDAAGSDDATRVRARGWAISLTLTAAAYHHASEPAFCRYARSVLDDLLAGS